MIRTENLTKNYGKDRGVFNLNLDVPKGKIYGFIGPNGAGKTTTIKMLCGLIKPDSGKAFVGDVQVTPYNISRIKKKIGYMPDIFGVYEQMSVWEYLDFYGAAFKIPVKQRKKRIEEVLALTESSHMIDYQVTSLSRGMRQRIGLAKTLIHDPEILILDEPAGGLDPNARIEMRQTISRLKNLGKTILLSSHILPELSSVCDLVGIIFKGKLLVQGTVKEISASLQEKIIINVTVDSDVNEAKGILERIDCVENVKILEKNLLQFTFTGAREQIKSVLRILIENKVVVRWFYEEEIDLEDVFLNITRRA
ncbi:MAG TPA: ABC transporter ATP-binding protein [Victivallales bacterium]|nr:ABC transporter ATP-binding protein [Victivallales bacterium]HPO90051.1 ABC transporter ATP-binding protein [Victivallales bacterium]HRR28124.1 ABC transporter ATP-binding protein [Victivallales bacterium]HRU02230.1 ABC transporter ATP-binding protein [Victivallales bacterium]